MMILENQQFRINIFLIPKIGNHTKTSDISIDFVHLNNLTGEENKVMNKESRSLKRFNLPVDLSLPR
ncbi:hypothetical protein DF209_02710 [Pectobacterium polaris]|nr:hypothetical protein DF209_02710 [Pectobacterium polaris]